MKKMYDYIILDKDDDMIAGGHNCPSKKDIKQTFKDMKPTAKKLKIKRKK